MLPSAISDYPVFRTARDIRCFSLVRHALAAALAVVGTRSGTRILLPEYICRDVLAPLNMAGATLVWYPVGESLEPALAPADWPAADIVLMVDYFGFPQAPEPFRAYAARTGAIVIEDNAHGLFSRDAAGTWLGQRGQFGLYSMRKTLPIPDGAALTVNDTSLGGRLPPQLPFVGTGLARVQTLKASLRKLPLVGTALARLATAGARGVRRLRTGQALPVADPESERLIAAAPEPWCGLPAALMVADVATESERRRRLYAEFAHLAATYGIRPVFAQLPDGCVPYGFPFRADTKGIAAMRRRASTLGLDLVLWPEMPTEIAARAPDYYRDVWVVNFLF